jgi:two-component system sensor histidine kinase/response regulator
LEKRLSINENLRRDIRILIAEDNKVNQLVALRVLEKMGFLADIAANGQEAIGALEAQHYDLIFMDVQMPKMDGFAATKLIRSGATKVPDPGIPIIAMTANAMSDDRAKCLAAGMDDYIAKPFSHQTVAEVLERWLAGTPRAEPASAHFPDLTPAIFDSRGLCERTMNDTALILEMIRIFLTETPGKFAALQSALAHGQSEAIAQLAHTIKGTALTIGGNRLAALAVQIETAGKTGTTSVLATLLQLFEAEFGLLNGALAKWSEETARNKGNDDQGID